MKEVVFVVVLVDWICEAMSEIVKTLKPEVAQKYTYKNEKDIQKATDEAVKHIDAMTANKEKELLEV